MCACVRGEGVCMCEGEGVCMCACVGEGVHV